MRFQELKVTLSDFSYVRYHRSDTNDAGGYTAEVRLGRRGQQVEAAFWTEQEHATPTEEFEHVLRLRAKDEEEFRRWADESPRAATARDFAQHLFAQALDELGVNPIFLEDSRVITGDALEPIPSAAQVRPRPRERRLDPDEEIRRRREIDVEEALNRVRIYLSQLAFAGTQAGSARVDNVYQNVAAAVIQSSSKPGRPNKTLLPALRDRVAALEVRAEPYEQYGLIPESPMPGLSKVLSAAEFKHGPVLTQVLSPHLDGFSERLDALQPGLTAVSAFIDVLNSFLIGKWVFFRPDVRGLRIMDTDTRQRLDPTTLSSGEKQIVLLFSDIISLQSETRLFLIDEPELSLNPDWQRNLMPSLLAVTETSNMQLIAATHSIEIMAQYRERRVRLGT
jgi:hypothetical protein